MASHKEDSQAAQPTAFLSHSSADAALAQELCKRLESQDVRCWIAPRDLRPGQPYAEEIVYGIEGCGALILLATTNSVSSENVLNELEQAHRLHRTLLTVMVKKPAVPRDLAYYVARLHWLESTGDNLYTAADQLAAVLHGRKTWPAVASPPSMGRRIAHALPAFLGTCAALLVVLTALGLFGWHYVQNQRRQLAADYRSLGWVTLSAGTAAPGQPLPVSAQLWLGDANLPFAKTHLTVETKQPDGTSEVLNLNSERGGGQTGEESFDFTVAPLTGSLSTHFAVPGADASQQFCIEQKFVLQGPPGAVTMGAAGQPLVKEAALGSHCQ